MVSFKILNGPTELKKPAADATDQEQAEYEARVANRDKLVKNMELQKTLEGRNFKIAATHIKAINKRKQQLEKAKKVSVTTDPVKVPTPGPVTDTPSPLVNPPPTPGSTPAPEDAKPPRKRIEAVTPPIAIPPRSGNKEKEIKPAETAEKDDAAKKETPEKSE